MEEMNNTLNPDQPVIQQSETPSIHPSPKPNIYKCLFIVSLIILVPLLVYFLAPLLTHKYLELSNNQKNQKIINISPTLKPTVVPTVKISDEVTPTKTINIKLKPPYKVQYIQNDQDSTSQLVLTDQNKNKIIVVEAEYLDWKKSNYLGIPSFSNLTLSPDNNFLFYHYDSAWESEDSFLYDINNRENIPLRMTADFFVFSPDSKYFYACGKGDGGPGYRMGGAVVKQLNSKIDLFPSDISNYFPFTCKYNQSVREMYFSKLNGEKYSINNEEEIISRYKFSEKTSSLTEIN